MLSTILEEDTAGVVLIHRRQRLSLLQPSQVTVMSSVK